MQTLFIKEFTVKGMLVAVSPSAAPPMSMVPIEELEVASDNKFFAGSSGNWAKITHKEIDMLSSLMKKVHEEKITDNPNGVETAKAFSWRSTAKKIMEVVNA